MQQDELMELWVKVLFEKLSIVSLHEGSEEESHRVAREILNAVYAVGHEAGRDEERISRQLQSLGKPYGANEF